LKFLANFALNYWPDGTRIETKRSHSPKVEGKESEKRASVVGFARVLVESERVEKSNLKKFFLFFFVSLVSLVFFFPSTLFLTHYLLLEGESTKRTTPTHEGTLLKSSAKKVRILPAFFISRPSELPPKSNQPTLLVLHK